MKIFHLSHYSPPEKPRILGVFSTQEALNENIEKYRKLSGFKKYPEILKNHPGTEDSGFFIQDLTIDEFAFRTLATKSQILKNASVFVLTFRKTDDEGNVVFALIGAWSDPKFARQHAIKLKKRHEYAGAEILEDSAIVDGFFLTEMKIDTPDWIEGFQVG